MIGWTLLAPLGLLALLALAIPVLLHLIRRAQTAPIDFPALRWLDERAKPRRRFTIEQPWLLLLRLLLLALVALLLAQPLLRQAGGEDTHWVVLVPPVTRAQAERAIAAHPLAGNVQWRWLQAGFPDVGDAPLTAVADIPLASLLRELDARLPANVALTVISPREVAGLDGASLRVQRPLDWRVVDGSMAPATAAEPNPPLQVALHSHTDKPAETRYVRAALTALPPSAGATPRMQRVDSADDIPAGTQWVFWFDPNWPAALQAWVEAGGVAFVSEQPATRLPEMNEVLLLDAAGAPLLRQYPLGHGRVLSLRGEFTAENFPVVLDADFPQRLQGWMTPPGRQPQRAPAESMLAAVEEEAAARIQATLPAPGSHARGFDAILIVLIAVLYLLERLLAAHRRERTS